ncbi:SH3-domain-containing protein [Fistulina hepatica ATCC 64428]|uniref:SH3-domain-containing protein n=1 Tax=Fistulina hepatica ATCC 64428 TaxID=1128425 RepID=A0A0D7A5E9_9AGAR|nr:SH3-domain-containing protein [Fistulina hepatica ATCC 64428]
MVFSNLSPHEKDAFFSLLDEYFTSRPSILAGGDAKLAVSALGKAFSSVPSGSGKFGDVDASSAKNMFTSLRHSTAQKNAPAEPLRVAPAFAPKKNTFAPPPARRVPEREPQPEVEPEPETQGEWVEAIYDYTSTESSDISIQEGQHILLIERSSADWWTGEVDGRRGLFPASYVKVI